MNMLERETIPSEENEGMKEITGQKEEKVKDKEKQQEQPAGEVSTREPLPEVTANLSENDQGKRSTNKKSSTTEKIVQEKPVEKEEPASSSDTDIQEKNLPAGEDKKTEPETSEDITVKDVDYDTFGIDDLLKRLELLLEERPVHEVRHDVESIKINFYKKYHQEIEVKRKHFLEEGGDSLDFKPGPDNREEHLKYLLKLYREKKSRYNREIEEQKKQNLEEKYNIIEEIRYLVNRKESINKTFQDFRDLQERWRNVGLVPQQYVKDLWETYHYHVEKFYDYIKINKELRDLDLRKNMEIKIQLCEQAESLSFEPDIVNAFKTLQKYHEQWREIGPVPKEHKAEIWERFKEATRKINKKHQDYFQEIKEIQKKNLEQKNSLAERAEEISHLKIESHREWEINSKEIMELQKIWKTIGFAPRKQNNSIYERFRKACDLFFNKKREYYAENKEIQMNNLQLKTDLCIQAEALRDSNEWRKTTEDFINLQKKWKSLGPAPKKYSDQIWKRFRAACDTFFENKSKYYKNREKNYTDNLKHKQKLIEEIKNFEISGDTDIAFAKLQDFQRQWTEIGYVPIEKKEEVGNAYREAVNKLFSDLNISEHKKNLLKYKTKLDTFAGTQKADIKLRKDREKFINRMKQLENDITVWENNIGFFAHSKNAESLKKDISIKIENARASIFLLKDKIRLIDEMDND